MSLLLAWLVFPLVLLVLAIGCGLLVERLGGATIDGALLAPIGFAAVIVIAGLFTTTSATAPFAAPACVAAAIAGLVAGRTRLGVRRRSRAAGGQRSHRTAAPSIRGRGRSSCRG